MIVASSSRVNLRCSAFAQIELHVGLAHAGFGELRQHASIATRRIGPNDVTVGSSNAMTTREPGRTISRIGGSPSG